MKPIEPVLRKLSMLYEFNRKLHAFTFDSASRDPLPPEGTTPMKSAVQHLNPEGLHVTPAYSQAVQFSGPGKTIIIGGQNAVDSSGAIIGKGDLKAQTRQVLLNIEIIMKAAGAGLENIVKWNVYLVQGQSAIPGYEAFREAWGNRPNPPPVTVLFVAGLGNPDFLVEIEAMAFVPQE
jgi:enamine deaminase RidA (YjgF/YER057c/UK114 family)